MKRLTMDNPKDNIENELNLFYIKDRETWVRGGGPGPEYADVSLFDFVRDVVKTHIPDVKLPKDDDNLSMMIGEWLFDGPDTAEGVVALLYTAAWAFSELRERLKQYEDTGLEPEEIRAFVEGRKPLGGADFDGNVYAICPECCAIVENGDWRASYCPDCGQKMIGVKKVENEIVMIPKEDAEFLSALRHELLTQPTDGNRDPRFWGVKDEVIEWGYDEEWADGWGVYDSENCCKVGENNDLQSVISELTDPDGYAYNQEDFEDCTEPEEVVDRANDLGGGFSLNYYRKLHIVSEDHLFITKKACQEYIDRYGYNHNKPHTYVMTADRCPEYERLLKILKETDWAGGAQ